ncbi:alpha/beta fold hydrolase [Motilibacter aurantiacus]|uniref:alpha/beta fold hydrolase n=1 Tax=Motilibacter aurantiacus TaxID=2714955 RepID=UPI00140A0CB8|nr:alpha/beta fold hydrolase [Motilibacter aurantiacus]NHC44586.1 alpha/beta fold hydrolase [Motilibacter aurantiacus]
MAADDDATAHGPATGAGSAPEALRRVARAEPGRVAVCVTGSDGPELTTYAELDRAVDRLAQALAAELGPPVHGAHRVAVRLHGPLEVVVATLALERAALAVVPVDPSAPIERVEAILADVEAALLLSDVPGDADEVGRRVEHPLGLGVEPVAGLPAAQPSPDALAAVMFTSGSTGTPKGIVVPHAQRQAFARWVDRFWALPDGARVGTLSVGTVGFYEALVRGTVMCGGTLHAYPVRRLGLGALAPWLLEHRIQALPLVPTLLRALVPALPPGLRFPDLTTVVLGAEAPTWEDVRLLRTVLPPGATVYNLYGTTETGSVAGLALPGDAPLGEGRLPAGRAIDGCRIEITGEDGTVLPAGVRGEVTVVTAYGGTGYWNRPEQTRAVWRARPDGTVGCRTGDAGTLGADGVLQCHGRMDHVVKIAGNRVELGEVESALQAADGVAGAAAVGRPDAEGDVRLHAFVTAAADAVLHPAALRGRLARRLPGYMLPDSITILDELPGLPGGKVDRSALPEPALRRERPAAAASSQLEAALVAVWQEVLGREVGADDDFFDLGGDSLRAARAFALMKARLGYDRPISLLLDAPTVALLAAALEAGVDGWEPLVPVRVAGEKPPVFLVHGGGGNVLFARRLAQGLPDGHPVYAFQAPTLSGRASEERTLEELAARYVAEARRCAPDGPYLLFGYSLGGVIAFEMALQLQAAGAQVGLLAMGDSDLPAVAPAPSIPLARRAADRLGELRGLPPQQALRRAARLPGNQARNLPAALRLRGLRRQWREQLAQVAPGAPVDVEFRVAWSLQESGRLLAAYAPARAFDGSVVMVSASESRRDHAGEWAPYVTGKVHVEQVDGRHESLLQGERIDAVAAALAAALGRVGALRS